MELPVLKCTARLFGIWIVIALGALIACSVVFVHPYLEAKAYEETNCTLSDNYQQQINNGAQRQCYCGTEDSGRKTRNGECSSVFLCARISVNFTVPGEGTSTGMFYATDSELHKQRCSYVPPCKYDLADNKRNVEAYFYRLDHGGEPFSCFYHPYKGKDSDVFKYHRNRVHVVVHAILWPTLVILFGITGLSVSLWFVHKKQQMTKNNPHPKVKYTYAELRSCLLCRDCGESDGIFVI